MIIYFHNVKKEFFTKTIFSGIKLKLSIEKGEKVGIVAKNGDGKTTLLKLISKQEQSDAGNIKIEPKRTKMFYLSVDHIENFEGTTEDFMLSINPYFYDLKKQIEKLSIDLDNTENLENYSNLLEKYEKQGAYNWEAQINGILKILGILDKDVKKLSGGEKSKLILASIQIIDADLILLDEPTNHLDIKGLEQLENYINQDKKSYIIISHDQKFLDNVVQKIISIQNHRLKIYEGNYTVYKTQLDLEEKQNFDKYIETEREIKRLETLSKDIIQRSEEGMTKVVTHKSEVKNKRFINTQGIRLKEAPDRDKMSANYFNQKLESKMQDSKIVKRRIGRIQKVIKPKKDWGIKVDFNDEQKSPDIILRTENISYSFLDQKTFLFPDLLINKGEKIALIGINGIGKSTYAKIIASTLKGYRGQINMPESVSIGYYSQTYEILDQERNVLENLLNLDHIQDYKIPLVIEARNFLHQMLFTGDMVKQKVSELSQGEKSKLALAKIIYMNPSFLLLDEPTNHLDITSKERIEEALKKYTGAMLLISHDRYFMESIKIDKYIELK